MGGIYKTLACYYDILGEHIDYRRYAAFADRINGRSGRGKSGIALDLCCGTGSLSLELDALGYDVIGVDMSGEMLDEARRKSEGKSILYICQDMRCLDLYGTVDLTVCSLDSINYLTKSSDVAKVFSRVHTFLEPGGIFVFDVNTKARFEEVYADNSYVFEEDGIFCVWQNRYDRRSRLCDFYLTMFGENSDGKYDRNDEHHRERLYSDRLLSGLLTKSGFEMIGKYADTDENAPSDGREYRCFYAAKAVK